MPAQHGHTEASGDRLERVLVVVGMQHCVEQQRVQHRLSEPHAGARLRERQELHVEPDVVTDENGVRGVAGERGQHDVDGRLAREHRRRDPVHGGRAGRHPTLRVDQPLERLVAQQPPVHHSHGAHRDDLVTAGRIQAGGLGIEDRVREIAEVAIGPRQGLLLPVEEVEIVELRSAGEVEGASCGRFRLRLRQREQESQIRRGPGRSARPDLAAVTSDDVAHARRREAGERLVQPGLESGGLGRRSGPVHLELSVAAGRSRGQRQFIDTDLVVQPTRQVRECPGQRMAVHPDPKRVGCRVLHGYLDRALAPSARDTTARRSATLISARSHSAPRSMPDSATHDSTRRPNRWDSSRTMPRN